MERKGETGEPMHIALCDDNLADRHQMERLLKRESDKQTDTSDMFIVDSYGNPEVMLSHPKAYDLFFIDICLTEGMDAVKVVAELMEKGANAPIVMCCSEIDYKKSKDLPGNTLFLDKPIKVAELHEIIEQAKVIKSEMPDKVELRKLMDTVYADISDVIYACEKKGVTHVMLANGEELMSQEPIWLFRRSLGDRHPEFVFASPMNMININHIKSWGAMGTVIMEDGKKFHVARVSRDHIKEITGDSNT